MSNVTRDDIRTLGYVLRRTNYGEADRILNLITPLGKISAVAKGVRREKSKLAGGVEMFSLIDINIHRGKSDLGIVTSAKMLKYYGKIMTDYNRMEFAATVLRKVSLASEGADNPEYFDITDQVLAALNGDGEIDVIETWFWFNLAKAVGEQPNLYRDTDGEKLDPGLKYIWNSGENSLMKRENGDIGAAEIKLMRLMLSSKLAVVLRVKGLKDVIPKIINIARAVYKI